MIWRRKITKLEELVNLLKKAPDEVFIQLHNVPDPDDTLELNRSFHTFVRHRAIGFVESKE